MNIEDIQFIPIKETIDILFVNENLDPVLELSISLEDARRISEFIILNKL